MGNKDDKDATSDWNQTQDLLAYKGDNKIY